MVCDWKFGGRKVGDEGRMKLPLQSPRGGFGTIMMG